MNEIAAETVPGLTEAAKLFANPCEFYWGASSVGNLPPESLPEVAFAGRSNVGKSSLINALTGRRTLARVSAMPGRTREINFFVLGAKLVLADLPGYGYAKASKTLSAEWQKLIFAYLRGRAPLRRVVLLIDARRGVMDVDRSVMEMLDKSAVSYCLTLTKADQLKPPTLKAAVIAATAESQRHTAAYPQVFATSATGKLGLDEVKAHLAALAPRTARI
jgi:GTP-binding protein